MKTEVLPRVVLDACVLASYTLCDSLLRLAEEPELYDPRWSDEIFFETVRALETKLNWPLSLAQYFESQIRRTFPDACVNTYGQWLPHMTNHPKDRHVVAAAIAAQAQLIVTFNLRHFQNVDLAPWNVSAIHPDPFLQSLFLRRPDVVRDKLYEQAEDRKRSLTKLLSSLRLSVPHFVDILQA